MNVVIPSLALQLGTFDFLAIALLIIVGVGVVALYLWWIGWAIFKKPLTGEEALLGKHGTASADLTPEEGGEVTIDGIIWKAKLSPEAGNKTISKGEPVVVVRVSSLTLIVDRFTLT